MPDQDPDLWARRASSFGAAARAYAEHRPAYAQEAIAWCLAGADRPVRQVLDLGAGTGALTAGLLTAGVSATAVEPDPGMLAELRRRLPDEEAWVPSYAGFGAVTVERFPHVHPRTAASLTAMVGTHSHTMVISTEERPSCWAGCAPSSTPTRRRPAGPSTTRWSPWAPGAT